MAELSGIRQGMQVKSSDGEVVGHVAPGGGLSVTPVGGGMAHAVSEDWVARVDEHVHLRHSAAVLRGRWSGNAGSEQVPTQSGARAPIILGMIVIGIALLLLLWTCAYSSDNAPRTVEQAPDGTHTSDGNHGQ